MSELPPDVAAEARRRLTATRALDMRNNRYGAAAAYIAWALEILVGLDPLDSVVSLADGSTIESLLVGHLPVSEDNLTKLRTEVQQMSGTVEGTDDPAPRSVEAIKNVNEALGLIEQALKAE